MLILLDADGVLWRGAEVIPQAPGFIRRAQAAGHRCVLVSNNAGPSRTDYAYKCTRLGLNLGEPDVFSVNYLAGPWLRRRYPAQPVLLVGSPQLGSAILAHGVNLVSSEDWLTQHGLIAADGAPVAGRAPADIAAHLTDDHFAAVLMGMDTHINYMQLALASVAVQRGAVLLAANEDWTYPIPGGLLLPGNGSLVEVVAHTASAVPEFLGKPAPHLLELIEAETGVSPEQMLMIGDRWETDVQFAVNGGIRGWLVLTGVTKAAGVPTLLPAGISVGTDLDAVAAALGF
jgi:HAD superfamily hydrolase (TIGR01450 family)